MANMSYCRFDNTAYALHDCVDILGLGSPTFSSLDIETLIPSERLAAKRLYDLCFEYIELMDREEIRLHIRSGMKVETQGETR